MEVAHEATHPHLPGVRKAAGTGKTAFRCDAGHAFDISAKGHVNLLTDKHRNSQAPGDNKDMVDARRRFLATGAYNVLGHALAALAASYADELWHMADVGCGEGTWTIALRNALPAPERVLFGMDNSKEASRRAAGKDKRMQWIVASLFHLPLADGSMDGLFNVFAPSADAEFARVLRPGGLLLTAIPGKRHLWALKQALYEVPRENDEALPELPSFTLEQTVQVADTICLEGADTLADLLSMTPSAWKAPKEGMARYAALQRLETPISFVLAVHRRR
jgi:23S rRNA (guanine745-N1)-methyltransferase